jgi:8-oxo-dGTP pyrophosphatase MutT (NUDIX family)
VKQQAAAIPFRISGRKLEVCLIRRKGSRNRWGIPKGFVERGDSARDAALKEAEEEAGLRGKLVGASVGRYKYDKWGTTLEVTVYLMKVKTEEDDWQESDYRERHWKSFRDAARLLGRHPVRPFLKSLKERLS